MRWLLNAFLVWSFWTVAFVRADTVLLQSVGSSNVEYRGLLEGGLQYQSPTQVYKSQHPSVASREHLLALFSEAQKAFVSRSSTEAERLFKLVADQVTEEDWGPNDRHVLQSAIMRLAQLDKNDDRRDLWLQQFLLLGPYGDTDRSLFPPPLFERLKQLDSQAPALSFGLQSADWRVVLVNGLTCTYLDCPRIPKVPGRLRLTFLSDRWLPQIRVLTSAVGETVQSSLHLERVPWVEGACGHESFNKRTDAFSAKEAFFSLSCSKPALTKNVDLAPRSNENEIAPFAQQTMPEVERPAFYKSKWFWIGAGGVATVATIAILAHQNSNHDERQTTVTH